MVDHSWNLLGEFCKAVQCWLCVYVTFMVIRFQLMILFWKKKPNESLNFRYCPFILFYFQLIHAFHVNTKILMMYFVIYRAHSVCGLRPWCHGVPWVRAEAMPCVQCHHRGCGPRSSTYHWDIVTDSHSVDLLSASWPDQSLS